MPANYKYAGETPLDRFWRHADVRGPDDCWTFSGYPTNRNYVHLHLSGDPRKGDRKRILAHRFSWIIHNAQDVPEGLVIDHICRNTLCVNPRHLRAVTQESNCMELAQGNPFFNNREKTTCKHGHPFEGANLARVLVKSRNKKRWIPTRICLTCQPHAHGHPRRYWLPEEVPEINNQESGFPR